MRIGLHGDNRVSQVWASWTRGHGLRKVVPSAARRFLQSLTADRHHLEDRLPTWIERSCWSGESRRMALLALEKEHAPETAGSPTSREIYSRWYRQ